MLLIVIAVSWIAGLHLATLPGAYWLNAVLFLTASAFMTFLLRSRNLTLLPALALAVLSLGMLRAVWPADSGASPHIQFFNGKGQHTGRRRYLLGPAAHRDGLAVSAIRPACVDS